MFQIFRRLGSPVNVFVLELSENDLKFPQFAEFNRISIPFRENFNDMTG